MGVKEFVESVWDDAVKVASKYNLTPEFVVSVAGLESGWGKSAPNFNFFGIKAPAGQGANLMTKEFINGKMVSIPQSFAKYDSPAQSFDAFGQFLTKYSRYSGVLGADTTEAEIVAMGKSGYATDPNYTSKLRGAYAQVQKFAPKQGGTFPVGLGKNVSLTIDGVTYDCKPVSDGNSGGKTS